jgi:hypothetical protein
MTRREWMLLAGGTVASRGRAETAAERGKRLVNECLDALGGDAFLKMEDRVESGRAYQFYRRELTGLGVAKIYTRYLTHPEPPVPGQICQRERENFGKNEDESGVLITEDGAWDLSWRGVRPREDEWFANYKDSLLRNILYILRQRLSEPGMTFFWQGADMYENLPVEIVEIGDAQDRTVTVYFSGLNKLPVRQAFKRRNPQYKDFDTETTVFAKFRDVGGGARWPQSTVRSRNGEKIYEMYADAVEINKNLTDNLFTLPSNLKMLPKQK